MIELFFNPTILFIFSSPMEWIVVIVAVTLLFGANKLPELAKSLGQARKEFKKGMLEAEQEENKPAKPDISPEAKPVLTNLDDEILLEELRRRQAKQLEQTTTSQQP